MQKAIFFCFIVTLVFFLFTNVYTQEVEFESHTIMGGEMAADRPTSVYAIDVDDDGDIDVLSASYGDDKIAWYENVEDESFIQHTITTNPYSAYSVFAIDVDGDGDIDVLSACSIWNGDDNMIAWYENDGNENFTEHIITTNADGARSVYAIDVDSDGDIDVLSASYYDDKIAWYENDGAENFTTNIITTNADGAVSVFAIDVDSDGDMDVLSASSLDDKIDWYENDGDENFTEHIIDTNAHSARSVYAIDVDDDGDMDVLSASHSGQQEIAWYENDGAENFTEHTIAINANYPNSVYAIDVDIDGDIDVIIGSSSEVTWFENDGDENFTEHVITVNAEGSCTIYAIDVDSNGDIDVLSAFYSGDKISWFENDGNENFTENIITAMVNAVSIYAIDLDSDGDMDLLSAGSGEINWYENSGTENFTLHNINTIEGGALSVFAIDVDGDGDIDVLSAGSGSYMNSGIAWYENDGNENFTEHTINTNAFGTRSIYAIDMYGDGYIDVLSGSGNGVILYWNDGYGNFFGIPIIENPASSVFAIDVDGDGDLDVLSASYYDDKIAWYENEGFLFFSEHIITTNADGVYSVYAIDVDGDGDIDVLSGSSNEVIWYENDGNENFTEHVITAIAEQSYSVYAIDIDNDSDIDVITNIDYYSAGEIALFENDGDENFTEYTLYTSEAEAGSVFAIDMEGDGDIDVLSGFYDSFGSSGEIVWHENLMINTDINDPEIPNSSFLTHNLHNYPNPFNPTTTISFQLSGVSSQDVELEIYNIKGQKIKTLTHSLTHQPTNCYKVTWNGTDDHNQPVTSGIYLYKLQAGKQVQTRKMILIK